MDVSEINDVVKPLLLKDLRVQCRARGISPAGSREALADRLKDHMLVTGDTALKRENANEPHSAAEAQSAHLPTGGNNYHRSEGQNVGNFLTERPSSRVLAPSGGGASQISFGGDADTTHNYQPKGKGAPPSQHASKLDTSGEASGADSHKNNYHRAGGQNVGNFLTDRNSSRVLAPPGGASQVTFG